MNIAIDLDGTLVNTPELIEKYSGEPFDVVKKGRWYDIIWVEHFDEIQFYPHAEETVSALSKEHDVEIVTRQLNETMVKKWLSKTKLKDIPIRFVAADFSQPKYSPDTDIIIEDLCVEVRAFDGIKFLIKKHYNRKCHLNVDYVFEDWSEVYDVIKLFEED
ncbi:MAG: 5' nucleotidase, NT5C type [Fervidobacterium sp.]